MKSSLLLIASFLILFSANIRAQNNEVIPLNDELIVENRTTVRDSIDPLTPSRAAFYSAILPGLGQAYNKKYWKAPIAMGGVMCEETAETKQKRCAASIGTPILIKVGTAPTATSM